MLFLKLSKEALGLLITATILMTRVDMEGISNFCFLINKSLHSHSQYEVLRLNFLMETARRSLWFGREYGSKKGFKLDNLFLSAELFKTLAFHAKQKNKPSLSEMQGKKHDPQNISSTHHKEHEYHPYLRIWGTQRLHRTQNII